MQKDKKTYSLKLELSEDPDYGWIFFDNYGWRNKRNKWSIKSNSPLMEGEKGIFKRLKFRKNCEDSPIPKDEIPAFVKAVYLFTMM